MSSPLYPESLVSGSLCLSESATHIFVVSLNDFRTVTVDLKTTLRSNARETRHRRTITEYLSDGGVFLTSRCDK